MRSLDQLNSVFSEMTKPTIDEVIGDDIYQCDITSDGIMELINTPFDELTKEDFDSYLGTQCVADIKGLVYLLPAILRIWNEELYSFQTSYIEWCHHTFFHKKLLIKHLNEKQKIAVENFLFESFCQRCSSVPLIVNTENSAFKMMAHFNAIGTFIDIIPRLWEEIWLKDSSNYLIYKLHFISLFVFESENNPFYHYFHGPKRIVPSFYDYSQQEEVDVKWLDKNLEYIRKYFTKGFFLLSLSKISPDDLEPSVLKLLGKTLICMMGNDDFEERLIRLLSTYKDLSEFKLGNILMILKILCK